MSKTPPSIVQHRSPLMRTRRALESGRITLGFIGGSITADVLTPRGRNWPEPVIAWFKTCFPQIRIQVENVAIGATGSDLAAIRAQRDLMDRSCDLIFVEFAVNDNGTPSELRNRTREGLLRQLLATGTSDVVLVYTFCQEMYVDMEKGKVPSSIAEFEVLGKYYGINSVWVGLQALREVQAGHMRWEEWLPDGLHPDYRGSLSYAQSVVRLLEHAVEKKSSNKKQDWETARLVKLPPPLNRLCWDKVHLLPLADLKQEGPWVLRRWSHYSWFDQVLSTSAPGARLSFSFCGRSAYLCFDFGRTSSEFRYRIDGKKWKISSRDRPSWCSNAGWPRLFCVADNLSNKKHSLEVEVIHGNRQECLGTQFDLGFIGIIQ
jgi:hypothetical protein